MPGRGGRRLFTIILICLVILVSATLVAFSPLALELWKNSPANWNWLSEVGQTYGAASALLAMFALVGVAVSLVLQAREAKSAREQTLRSLHGELMRMAMEDPLYRACWGAFFTSDDPDAQRAHMYVNQIINNWLTMWELRGITEAHLRSVASIVLAGPYGRKYWDEVRRLRMKSASGRRERRFYKILDEEYERIRNIPPRPLPPAPATRERPAAPPYRLRGLRRFGAGMLAAFAAALAFLAYRRARRQEGRPGRGR